MIFFYIIEAIRKVVWFFTIPKPEDVARIDPGRPCPVCGWRHRGRLRCIVKQTDAPIAKDIPPTRAVFCQVTCTKCGARYFEKPVRKVSTSTVLPSVPRDEIEMKQDRQAVLQQDNS